MSKTSTNEYSGEKIVVLEGLEPVRKRPAMYIGSTDSRGLHHIITEIVDNSVDEALAGAANNIWVIVNQDNTITVVDNGRGIPVDMMPKYGKSALEIVMTKLHAGGKFNSQAYKVSGGLHGVGASVVNALSQQMDVHVFRDGKIYHQGYKRGKPTANIETVTALKINHVPKITTGTVSTFLPDEQIFHEGIKVDFETIKKSLKQRAYLVSNLYFHVYDDRVDQEAHFYFEGGIRSLVAELNRNKEVVSEPIFITRTENLESANLGEVEVQIAIQYNDSFSEQIESFVNVIHTVEGGSHVTGFRSALTRAVNDYIKKQGGKEEGVTGEDTREGLTAVVYVKMASANLQFEGQTKSKLGNSEIQPLVQTAVKEGLDTYFEEHPSEARSIAEKTLLALKARLAAKAAKDAIIRKGALEGSSLPGKLADCQEKNPELCELYLVEGDSAGGSAKQGRDRKFQAILPLRGKILNTERARLDKIIEFAELKDLIIALGMGIGESLKPEKLRYHRVIIMTDADVDGEHIRTLLLTFFYRHIPEIINSGHLYIAQPPLYKIQHGKSLDYAYNDSQKNELLKGDSPEAFNIQRYKGLGEMNPEQLWETTMNPKNRILKKVTVDDANRADQVFTTLMGKEVPPRKRFIQTHAKTANLDI